jgi:hypothetical protein
VAPQSLVTQGGGAVQLGDRLRRHLASKARGSPAAWLLSTLRRRRRRESRSTGASYAYSLLVVGLDKQVITEAGERGPN